MSNDPRGLRLEFVPKGRWRKPRRKALITVDPNATIDAKLVDRVASRLGIAVDDKCDRAWLSLYDYLEWLGDQYDSELRNVDRRLQVGEAKRFHKRVHKLTSELHKEFAKMGSSKHFAWRLERQAARDASFLEWEAATDAKEPSGEAIGLDPFPALLMSPLDAPKGFIRLGQVGDWIERFEAWSQQVVEELAKQKGKGGRKKETALPLLILELANKYKAVTGERAATSPRTENSRSGRDTDSRGGPFVRFVEAVLAVIDPDLLRKNKNIGEIVRNKLKNEDKYGRWPHYDDE